jgi:hypothetical protein
VGEQLPDSARTASQRTIRTRHGRCAALASHVTTLDVVCAGNAAIPQALDRATVGGGAVDPAVVADRHLALFDSKAGEVAIGPAIHGTGSPGGAAEVAAIAARDRRIDGVVEIEAAILPAAGAATVHVVAEDSASVAVVAALGARVSVAALAPVAFAASIAGRASGKNLDNQNEDTEKDGFHGNSGGASYTGLPRKVSEQTWDSSAVARIDSIRLARARA